MLFLATCTLCAAESKLQVRHRESGGIGYNKGYSTVDYTVSHIGELSQFLLNARGHLFNDARFASNLGVGARRAIYGGKYLLGGNFYYDFRESKHLHTNQVGGGLEFLSQCVDVRMNGYLPVGDDVDYKTEHFLKFQGNQILEKQKLIAALPAIDLEVGGPIKPWIYLGGGPYYLFGRDVRGHQLGNAVGGKAHCDIDVHRYVSLGASISYDKIFNTKVQGYLAINIPLGGKKEKPAQRRLYDTPIYRNEIIPLHQKTRTVAWYREEDGDSTRVFFVNNLASPGGNGSFESPFSSLKEAETSSQENDIIYVYKGDGTPRNMDEGIVLKDGQRLVSSGADLQIDELLIPALTPGDYPVLTNIHPFEPIITNPGETHIEDFYFLNPDQYYFWGDAWGGPWTTHTGSNNLQPPVNNAQPPPANNGEIAPPPVVANNSNNNAGPPYDFSDIKVEKPAAPDPDLQGWTVMPGNTPTPTPTPTPTEEGWVHVENKPPTPPPPGSGNNNNAGSGGGSWLPWRK